MPHVSRKPSPEKSKRLAKVVQKYLDSNSLSLRKAASQMGIGASHLSNILTGETSPDAGVCNSIADFLGIPRVQVYGLAGWLDLDEADDAKLTDFLKPFSSNPVQLSRLKLIYYSIGDKGARADFLKWVEQNH